MGFYEVLDQVTEKALSVERDRRYLAGKLAPGI